jgi:hypothetical protein
MNNTSYLKPHHVGISVANMAASIAVLEDYRKEPLTDIQYQLQNTSVLQLKKTLKSSMTSFLLRGSILRCRHPKMR